ncbi:hypothetical protein N7535_002383 [Penicillium sp. DV-2018c]|nr:hypothetical protein N7535_002383 [Penicillium sp. DV-2018c]
MAHTDDAQTESVIPANGVTRAHTVSDSIGHERDEESPLLPRPDAGPKTALKRVGTIITVLLLGEFISNADATLVLAAAGRISSEFNRLRDASWLSTGYTLGVCAAQPMVIERHIRSGIGSNMPIVILGRAISGTGGAGIMTISSIIITDIVPRRDVATWRAYVNIAMTLGRSLGGPIGGWLSDTIGWRWLFILQAPFLALAAALVVVKLHVCESNDPDVRENKLGKVDFLGTALLGSSIVAMTTLLDQGGKSFPWSSWQTALFASGGISLLVAFVLVEAYVAREPVFNLRILRRTNVSTAYFIGALQIAAQLGMMFSVPLYFQVTQRASTTAAGAHLVPAVIGNTMGGLLAGMFIRRTGQFKSLLVVAGLVASISYILLYLLWNGNTGFRESLYILPGGSGTGIAAASSFIAMSAMLPPEEIAMATAGYMLINGFSITAGVTITNSVLGMEFQRQLRLNLHGPGSDKVMFIRLVF